MDENAPLPSIPSAHQDGSASPKQQLAKQVTIAGSGGDGGIFSQLTSNPFFTAVGPPTFYSLILNSLYK